MYYRATMLATTKKKIRIAALIRSGALCKACSRSKCVDMPTPESPLVIACPICGEVGCDACNETGYYELTECPSKMISDVVSFIRFADLFHKGCPPVDGGALDQANWFLDASSQLKNDDALVLAESKK